MNSYLHILLNSVCCLIGEEIRLGLSLWRKKNGKIFLLLILWSGGTLLQAQNESVEAAYYSQAVQEELLKTYSQRWDTSLSVNSGDIDYLYNLIELHLADMHIGGSVGASVPSIRKQKIAEADSAMRLVADLATTLQLKTLQAQSFKSLIRIALMGEMSEKVLAQRRAKLTALDLPDPALQLHYSYAERREILETARQHSQIIRLMGLRKKKIRNHEESEAWGNSYPLAFLLFQSGFYGGQQAEPIQLEKGCLAALDILKLTETPFAEGLVYFTLGQNMTNAGMLDKGQQYYRLGIEKLSVHPALVGYRMVMKVALGDIYRYQGSYDSCIHWYNEAMKDWQQVDGRSVVPEMAAGSFNLMGIGYLSMGLEQEGKRTFQRGLVWIDSMLNLPNAQDPYQRLSYTNVLAALSSSMTIISFRDWDMEAALSYSLTAEKAMGDLFIHMNTVSDKKALKIVMGPVLQTIKGIVSHVKAAAYHGIDEYELANVLFEQSLEEMRWKRRSREYTTFLNNYGAALIDQWKLDSAQQYLQLAEERIMAGKRYDDGIEVLLNLAGLYLKQGEITQAKGYAREGEAWADSLENPYMKGMCRLLYAKILGNENMETGGSLPSKEAMDSALVILKDPKLMSYLGFDPLREVEIIWYRGLLLEGLQRPAEAVAELEAARQKLDAILVEKAGYFSLNSLLSQASLLYDALLRSYARQDLAEDAFEAYEGMRSRYLGRMMSERQLQRNFQFPPAVADSMGELEKRTVILGQKILKKGQGSEEEAALLREISLLNKRQKALREEALSKHPTFQQLKGFPSATTEMVQHLLKPNEVMISYALSTDSSFAFVISPTGIQHISLPNAAKIKKAAIAFQHYFQQRQKGEVPRSQEQFFYLSQALYQQLIAPILAQVDLTGKELLIVPDGVLYLVPFEALVSNPTPQLAFSDYHFLLQDFALSYFPSASTFCYMRNNPDAEAAPVRSFLGLGDAVYHETKSTWITDANRTKIQGYLASRNQRDQHFQRLPHSSREVEEVAKLFPKSAVLLRENAAESQLKNLNLKKQLREYRYIHIAAHSWIDPRFSHLSSIVLSLKDSVDQDGLLQSDELLEFELNADMVVLSACQTGTGKIFRGEGVMGFQQSLIYAGAESMVLSLWSVKDEQTADFFIDFYGALAAQTVSRSETLRQNKLRWIEQGGEKADPFYWAPFVYIGEQGAESPFGIRK